jgi:hypothetical protein
MTHCGRRQKESKMTGTEKDRIATSRPTAAKNTDEYPTELQTEDKELLRLEENCDWRCKETNTGLRKM